MDNDAKKDQESLTQIFGYLAEEFPAEWQRRQVVEESEFETLKFFFQLFLGKSNRRKILLKESLSELDRFKVAFATDLLAHVEPPNLDLMQQIKIEIESEFF